MKPLRGPDGKFCDEGLFLQAWVKDLTHLRSCMGTNPEATLESLAYGIELNIAKDLENAARALRRGCREYCKRWRPTYADRTATLGFAIRDAILDCKDRIEQTRKEHAK